MPRTESTETYRIYAKDKSSQCAIFSGFLSSNSFTLGQENRTNHSLDGFGYGYEMPTHENDLRLCCVGCTYAIVVFCDLDVARINSVDCTVMIVSHALTHTLYVWKYACEDKLLWFHFSACLFLFFFLVLFAVHHHEGFIGILYTNTFV